MQKAVWLVVKRFAGCKDLRVYWVRCVLNYVRTIQPTTYDWYYRVESIPVGALADFAAWRGDLWDVRQTLLHMRAWDWEKPGRFYWWWQKRHNTVQVFPWYSGAQWSI